MIRGDLKHLSVSCYCGADMAYKTTCEECGGHNFQVTPHKNMGKCFNCGYFRWLNGKETKRAKVMSENVNEIRNLYTRLTQYYHSCLDKATTEYLIQRGYTHSMIEMQKIGYCPAGKSPLYRGEIAKEAGIVDYDGNAFLADRIIFPYWITGLVVTDIRGRSMHDDMRYKSLLGDTYYRGAIYPYNYHLRTHKRIILTEGEIKADIAYQANYPCLALPGMGNWKEGLIQEDQEIIILFDSQINKMRDVYNAIIRTAKRLKNVKVATLPLMNKDKQDIDSFILSYGTNMFNKIVNSALEYNTWFALQKGGL